MISLRRYLVFLAMAGTFFLWSYREPPLVNVEEILNDPDYYEGQKVVVTGVVCEMDLFLEGRNCFLGGEDLNLRVELREGNLQLNGRYRITGVIRRDRENKIFLHALRWTEDPSPAGNEGFLERTQLAGRLPCPYCVQID